MRFERGLLAALASMSACGPVVGDDDDQRVCTKDGPLRLLGLDADEGVASSGVTRIDDRYYAAVGKAVRVESDYGIPSLEIEQSRVVSFETCGESPRVVGHDVPFVYQDAEHFPGALLGRNETGNEVVLDPSGATQPQLLVVGFPGFSLHTDLGLLGVVADSPDAGVGTLTLQPYPAQLGDPPPPSVALLDGARIAPFSFAAHGTEALALTETGELERIDLASGDSVVIADDVDGFAVASDGGHVVYVQTTPTGFGPATLLDRATGTETLLAEDASAALTGTFGDDIVLDRDPAGGGSQRVIALADLTSTDLPAGLVFTHRVDDHTLLARRDQNQLVRYDVDSGTETVLFDGFVMSVSYAEDAAEVFLPGGEGVYYEVTGELWRVPYSGDAPERIAERVGGSRRRFDDGRIVTIVDVDATDVGTLIVVDPDTGDERVLDDNVYVMGLVAGPSPIGQPDVVDDGFVIYDVRDGDRSGIWLAKP